MRSMLAQNHTVTVGTPRLTPSASRWRPTAPLFSEMSYLSHTLRLSDYVRTWVTVSTPRLRPSALR